MRIPAFLRYAVFLVAISGAIANLAADASGEAFRVGRLKYLDGVTSLDLNSVNHVRLSNDGTFRNCRAWNDGRVSAYRRDAEKGLLSLVQVLAPENDNRTGVTSQEISPDGTLAYVASRAEISVPALACPALRLTDDDRSPISKIRRGTSAPSQQNVRVRAVWGALSNCLPPNHLRIRRACFVNLNA